MAVLEVAISQVRKLEGDAKTKAYVDITYGDWLIRGVRVVDGKNGLFVSMPRQKGKDGRWYDMVSANSDEFKEELAGTVLQAYQQ